MTTTPDTDAEFWNRQCELRLPGVEHMGDLRAERDELRREVAAADELTAELVDRVAEMEATAKTAVAAIRIWVSFASDDHWHLPSAMLSRLTNVANALEGRS